MADPVGEDPRTAAAFAQPQCEPRHSAVRHQMIFFAGRQFESRNLVSTHRALPDEANSPIAATEQTYRSSILGSTWKAASCHFVLSRAVNRPNGYCEF
jgi:hypothetical protein